MNQLWDGHALRRSFMNGVARFNGYLEDYAIMANALLDLYEASLDTRYIVQARTLADVDSGALSGSQNGGFFFTSEDHEQLITRPKPVFDGSTPSGNSEAVMALLRLHTYTGEERYLQEAERAIKLFAALMMRQPMGFVHLLEAVDFYHRGAREIVLVGDPGNGRIQGVARANWPALPTQPGVFRGRAGGAMRPDSFLIPPATKPRSTGG